MQLLDSLHIGSLVQLMLLSWFQYYGNKPIALLGGGTTKVGILLEKMKQEIY